MTIVWILIFIASLVAMVKGADVFLHRAEKMGLVWGLSPFVIGVVLTGIGTSLPELASSLFSLGAAPQIVAANAIGSNVANILLVIGLAAVFGKQLSVSKNLINVEIPLLGASTILFLTTIADKTISLGEAIVLVIGAIVYVMYTFFQKDEDLPEEKPVVKSQKIAGRDWLLLLLGLVGLVAGAQFLIKSVVNLATIFNIATGVIAISAVAIGTSLPELLVSIKAALKGKSEVALGNIFGSNVFNLLMVVGLPGLFARLPIDTPTFTLGIPYLIVATLLFMFSGISRKVHNWEGAFYVLIYFMFAMQLFG